MPSQIKGEYDYITEILRGTRRDDTFIIGNGNEYAIGGYGVDTARLNLSLNECISADRKSVV